MHKIFSGLVIGDSSWTSLRTTICWPSESALKIQSFKLWIAICVNDINTHDVHDLFITAGKDFVSIYKQLQKWCKTHHFNHSLTLSYRMKKTGQIYFENLAV